VIVINQGITHHTKFNPNYIQMCSFKGNLPSESTSAQYSKWKRKIVIVIDTYHTNSILRMHKHVHLKVTYPLRVHQFTVQQVGEKLWL